MPVWFSLDLAKSPWMRAAHMTGRPHFLLFLVGAGRLGGELKIIHNGDYTHGMPDATLRQQDIHTIFCRIIHPIFSAIES
jgi:hypothetical protein